MSSPPWARSTPILATLAALLAGIAPASHASDPVDAGRVIAWSAVGSPEPALPADLEGNAISEVVTSPSDTAFLMASGRLVVRSDNVQNLPPTELEAETVRSVAQYSGTWSAVTDGGEVVFWGRQGAQTAPGTVELTDIKQVSLGAGHGVALTNAGNVLAWGTNDYGEATVPPGLANVVKVAAAGDHTYALRADGTVVAWGRDQSGQVSDLPASLSEAGAVKDVAARQRGGLALLTNGTVVSWGDAATTGRGTIHNLPPTALADKTVVQIAAGSDHVNAAIADDGSITVWGNAASLPTAIPATLDGRTVSSLAVSNKVAYAIQRELLTISASSVRGTAKQGAVLTGTPATFSGAPTVTYQWLANGVPLAGATGTTLALTASLVGKRITFRTRAVDGSTTLDSDSLQTAAVAALPPTRVASKTSINKPKVKRTKATISVKVSRAGGTPTGKVTIQVKRGVKKVYKKAVTLKRGTAQVNIKRLKKGKYKVSASYAGDARSKASAARTQSFRVR